MLSQSVDRRGAHMCRFGLDLCMGAVFLDLAKPCGHLAAGEYRADLRGSFGPFWTDHVVGAFVTPVTGVASR